MKRILIGIITLTLILSVLLILPLAAQAYDDGTTCSNSNTGKHEFEVLKSQDVTCEQDGYIDWICMLCKHQAHQVTGKATGHNWQEQIREQPTCTKEGYGIEICTRCGRTKDNGHRIPALGHNYQRKVAQEATCTKDGTAVYTCSRCGDSYREPIPATGHKWGEWVDGDPATCVQYGNRYHQCTRCGQKEWERNYAGGLGDHDWGEWVTVKEPTATESGLEERTCKVDASHKEQREIPSNGKAELTITVFTKERNSPYSPKSEFAVGEEYWVYGSVTNTGDVDIELYDGVISDYFWKNYEYQMDYRYLLKPGETVDSWGSSWIISSSGTASLDHVTPGTETETLAGTISETYTIRGYRPGTDEVICTDTATAYIGVLKPADEEPAVYDISASYSEGPIVVEPSSSYERYWTGVYVGSENGGIDWRYHYGYSDSSDVTVDRIVWREFRDGGGDADFCFDPTIKKPQDHIIPGTETEEYAGEATLLVWAVGYLPDTDTEVCRSDALQIPLLVKKEEPKPAIKLIVIQYEPEVEKEAYKEGESFGYDVEVTNTGNVPLQFDPYIKIDTSRIINLSAYKDRILDPGRTWYQAGEPFSVHPTVSNKYMIPDPEDSPYAGRQPITFWVEGFAADDKDHTTPICDDGPITFEYKVAKPGGPEPWSIPEESQLKVDAWFAPSSARPSDPAGYQLGEHWNVWLHIYNVGSVLIDECTLRVDYTGQHIDDEWHSWHNVTAYGSNWYESEYKNIIEGGGPNGGGSIIQLEDVERGYIQFTATVKWIDPDSGNERTAVGSCSMPVISKTGVVLNKDYKDPANGEYFEEGEQIEWTLSLKNNSKEDLTNVTVTDYGTTLATYATFAASQEETVSVPKYTVTEYDAKVIGKVTNIANATGTDLKGTEHSYPSNPAVAKTGNKVPDPNDGDGGGGKDPLGPIHGYDIAVSIIKAEAHGPNQEDWYALNENVDYTVTVKNTGKDPIENVTVYDSLNGFTPIGTVGSLAPGEEKTFSFTWKVTPYNVDVMHYVVNQATVTYTFGGGINGTPMKSNKVYVKAGENGFIPEDGIIDPDGDPDGHFDPGLLHGEGDDCCAMTLLNTRDNEAYYQLTLCGEHAKVIADAKAAADAGDWKTAAETIRTALDEIYAKYYEAGDDSAKAAVMNERLTYYAHIGAYQTLAGDKAAAEKMALKLIQLCSMANTAPETLPDSLANGMNGLLGDNPDVTATGRVIGLFDGKNEVTDTYAGADARALKDVKDLLKAAKSYNYDEVFERGQIIWQTALDESVNAIYKAADRETRKQIAAWRISLDNLYTGERPMLEMLYPDNDAAVEEILMNLYRDTALDKEQVR